MASDMDLKSFRIDYEKETEKIKEPGKIIIPDKDYILIEALLSIKDEIRKLK